MQDRGNAGASFEAARGLPVAPSAAIALPQLLLLFVLFFLICCGLGYSSLNRVDWRLAPGGLEDVQNYAALVVAPPDPNLQDHTQYRVLVPYLARPFYHFGQHHLGSWDPIMFGLLVADSLFVAATVTLLLLVVYRLHGSYPIALGSALLYLLNFAVPNLRLAWFIDAGEGFFLMLLVWSLMERRYWLLPLWGIVGATAKESFVPFLIVFSLSWWLCERKSLGRPLPAALWMIASWCAALASLATLQWRITGVFRSPWQFGMDMHGNTAYLSHLLHSLADRNLWYVFLWLLPLSLLRLNRFPRAWRVATATTCLTAFALDAYYGGEPGTIGRALFSVSGTLLSASAAAFLFTLVAPGPDNPALQARR